MKIRVIKVFGREVIRIETHEEATVSDVVQAMLANRLRIVRLGEPDGDEEEETLVACECCGEMFDPAEAEEQAEVDERFADIAENLNWGERLVWDVKPPEDEEEA